AERLHRRWWMGWCLAGLATLSAVATILGLWFGQEWINQLPAGPDKQFWRDLGIPLVALGGFALISVFSLIAYRIMPMVTQRLQVVDIVGETIWLRGACSEYLAALRERPSTLPDE
ncbi:MAG: hypothetical protein NT069_20455, partial [Planctomycetota bacterium]|nr:hypothetical protein [Planctomycetota bacterium]